MAQDLSPTSYIGHHLTNRTISLGDSPFWTLHVDTLVTSVVLGVITFGFLWLAVRGATSGVPGKRQAFVELALGLIDDQVKGIFHGNRTFITPVAITVFVWVFFMNAMDLLPLDLYGLVVQLVAGQSGIGKTRLAKALAERAERDLDGGERRDRQRGGDPVGERALRDGSGQCIVDPDGAQTYADNAAALRAELESLDEDYTTGLASCERSTTVVSHQAFAYLTRYGLEFEAIAGLSPDAEPTAAEAGRRLTPFQAVNRQFDQRQVPKLSAKVMRVCPVHIQCYVPVISRHLISEAQRERDQDEPPAAD